MRDHPNISHEMGMLGSELFTTVESLHNLAESRDSTIWVLFNKYQEKTAEKKMVNFVDEPR